GASDLIHVTGAASIAGTLQAVGTGGSYTIGSQYMLLTAAGGVSGTFSNLTVAGSFGATRPRVAYDANDIFIVLDPNAISPFLVNPTLNQSRIAAAIDNSLSGGNLDLIALFNLPASQLPAGLDALSGEIHASLRSALIEDSRFVRQAVMERLSSSASQIAPAQGTDGPSEPAFWLQGFGSWGRFGSNGNAAAVDRNTGGFVAGVDAWAGGAWRVGAAAGYSRSDLSADARASSASVDTVHVAAYGGTAYGAWNLRLGGAYAWHSIHTERDIAFTGFADSDSAHYHGETGQAFGEVRYDIGLGALKVEPFAGLSYVRLHTSSLAESGSVAALTGPRNTTDLPYSSLGIASAEPMMMEGKAVTLHGSLAWQHALQDVVPSASLAFASTGASFTASGVSLARDSALVDAGFDLQLRPNATIGLAYSGQFGTRLNDHGIKGNFAWNF
ncbi:MAG TPA: autotransporter domain-containing protein, partial [Micropepsaceae bacterium]|nr:autotransporter domain-containing protein [Micropepsaceae bacterium]